MRRALTMAVDRNALHRALGLPEDVPVFDGVPTVEQFRRGEYPEAVPYDPEEATRLLNEAGWRDSDGDGTRDRAGTPLRFSLLVSPVEGYERTAVFLQAQFRQVGVDAQIQAVDWTLQVQRMKAGDFDAAVHRVILNLGYVLRPGTLLGESSYIGYADPEAAELVRALEEAVSPEEVDRAYARLGALLRRDLPFTVLYPQIWYTAVSRRLQGMKSPWRADPVRYMDDYALAGEGQGG